MKAEQFKEFHPFFSADENWNDIDLLQYYHAHHLFLIRSGMAAKTETDWPMVIHCSAETAGHSPTGYHPKGVATDFHFKTPVDIGGQLEALTDVLYSLRLINFVGLGIYLDWSNPGFHIDSRGFLARWGRIDGKYVSLGQIMDAI